MNGAAPYGAPSLRFVSLPLPDILPHSLHLMRELRRITYSVVCDLFVKHPVLVSVQRGAQPQASFLPSPSSSPFPGRFLSSACLCALSHVSSSPWGTSRVCTPSCPCDPPPRSPSRLDEPVIFSLSSPPQTQTCAQLSCFQLNLVLSGTLGHFVLWSPEREMTACRGEGIPTDQHGGLGRRDSGGGLKAVETPWQMEWVI